MTATDSARSTVVDSAGTSEAPGTVAAKPCHNCKRRRLRCDRKLPFCQKCVKKGENCLGYGKLLVWNRGVASRGKMMGKSFHVPNQAVTSTAASGSQALCLPRKYRFVPSNMPDGEAEAEDEAETADDEGDTSMSINPCLVDPLFQGLDHASRFYISHCNQ